VDTAAQTRLTPVPELFGDVSKLHRKDVILFKMTSHFPYAIKPSDRRMKTASVAGEA
jgi:hypothetical protein